MPVGTRVQEGEEGAEGRGGGGLVAQVVEGGEGEGFGAAAAAGGGGGRERDGDRVFAGELVLLRAAVDEGALGAQEVRGEEDVGAEGGQEGVEGGGGGGWEGGDGAVFGAGGRAAEGAAGGDRAVRLAEVEVEGGGAEDEWVVAGHCES